MSGGDARFVELYDRYYGKLVSYCRRRTTPDQVDDAVAETFLIAWRRIEDVPRSDEALPWLFAIAFRVIGHQYRTSSRQKRLSKKLMGLGVDSTPNEGEEIVVIDHESRQVIEALSRLRHRDQEILRLSVWEQFTHAEMGLVLGISEEAAKKRFARARTALARTYDRLDRQKMSPLLRKEVRSDH